MELFVFRFVCFGLVIGGKEVFGIFVIGRLGFLVTVSLVVWF